jgi:hypothetical protein
MRRLANSLVVIFLFVLLFPFHLAAESASSDEEVIVEALSGHYRGKFTNTNPQAKLPERLTFSLVAHHEMHASGRAAVQITGNARFYIGEFDSHEYIELAFSQVQLTVSTRSMVAKTREQGLTFKGRFSEEGIFSGEVFSDGLAKIGKVVLRKY